MRTDRAAYQAAMQAGHAMAWSERWDVAIEQYRLALQAAPGDVTALLSLGVASMRAGRLADALGAYEEARGARPDDTSILLKIGDLQYRLGMPAECGATHLAAAESYLRAGLPDKAIATWSRLIELVPRRVDTLEAVRAAASQGGFIAVVRSADDALAARRAEIASESADSVREDLPADRPPAPVEPRPDATGTVDWYDGDIAASTEHEAAAERDERDGRLAAAMDAVLAGLAVAPGYLPLHWRRADVMRAQGDRPAAAALFSRAAAAASLRRAWRDVVAGERRRILSLGTDETDPIPRLDAELGRQFDASRALARAQLHLGAGEVAAARAAVRAAADEHGALPEWLAFDLGNATIDVLERLAAASSEPADLARARRAVVSARPDDLAARERLAEALFGAGQLRDALDGLAAVGASYRARGEYARAALILRGASALAPDHLAVRAALVDVFEAADEVSEMAAELEELANRLEAGGEVETAIAALLRLDALVRDPRLETSYDARRRLEIRQRLAGLAPERSDFGVMLVDAYIASGQVSLAIPETLRVAEAALRRGEASQAAAAVGRALRLDPWNARARQLQARLADGQATGSAGAPATDGPPGGVGS